jgi:3' exoribonuclease, RNase T-like
VGNRVDVMVDLETYDTISSAAILSIGACVVPWGASEPTSKFYTVIDLESNAKYKRTTSASTKAFWDSQPAEARKIFNNPDAVDFEKGLLDFRNYLGKLTNWKSLFMWGNGSDFDNVILVSAYKALDVTTPWPFYQSRCFRTIRKELGHLIHEPVREGTHHNALDDAIYQAKILAKFAGILRPDLNIPLAVKEEPQWPTMQM